MPAFKEEISPALARALGTELRRAWPAFPMPRLTRGLAAALAPLELLARVDLLAGRLAASLPAPFPDAAAVLWRTLESPTFTGWMTLPCGTFVARQGLDDPDVSLALLAAMTPRWSSEGPIRPFIERHPDVTYDYLRRWCSDDDEHVRRLVSEGTRPRLPWAPLLRGLVADPSPNIPLLDALVDDASAYVRRSVANHVNDIARDHPDLALSLSERWLIDVPGASSTWVVRHGLRTLVKRGDERALALVGVDAGSVFSLSDLTLDRPRVVIGESVTFTFTLTLDSAADAGSDAIIDYRVHYVGARGIKAPKVFKLTRRRLRPGQTVTISRAHRFEHVSIRPIHAGPHTIDVQINGHVLGSATFEVIADG